METNLPSPICQGLCEIIRGNIYIYIHNNGFDVLINPFIKLQDVTRLARLGDLTNSFLAHIPTMTQSCRWKCHAFEIQDLQHVSHCHLRIWCESWFSNSANRTDIYKNNIYEYNIDYHWKKAINSIKKPYFNHKQLYFNGSKKSFPVPSGKLT